MFSALLSFLGGSVFRMVWGEIAALLTARQDHRHEIERLKLQAETDAAQHARNLEAIKVQADLGVQTIRVQAEADIGGIEAQAWGNAVAALQQPTGIWAVDFWNGIIRPLAASIAIVLWVLALNSQGWQMGEWDKELVGVVLGFFFASRELLKRGK
jgi:hypothetical protein